MIAKALLLVCIAAMSLSAALTLTSAPAYAAGESTPAPLPEKYVTSTPPQTVPSLTTAVEIEKPAAISGSGDMVISPIYRGAGGTSSYIRLANPTSTAATYTIRLEGTPSGNLYGTATYSVPAFSSPQYIFSEIETKAGVVGLQGSDTGYSLYLKSTNAQSGYQHVIYNSVNSFFENLSICTWNSATNYTALNKTLVNVHTSVFANNYPASVSINNFDSNTGFYTVVIYDAATGVSKGTYSFSVSPNSNYQLPMSYFEGNIGWVPSATQFHANLVFEAINGTTYSLVVGQVIINNGLGAAINMSQICGVNSGATPTVVVVAPPTEPTAYCGTWRPWATSPFPYNIMTYTFSVSVGTSGKLKGLMYSQYTPTSLIDANGWSGTVTGSTFVASDTNVAVYPLTVSGTIQNGTLSGTILSKTFGSSPLTLTTSGCN